MKLVDGIRQIGRNSWSKLIDFASANTAAIEESVLINNGRLFYVSIITAILNIVCIIIFYNQLTEGSPNVINWRAGIIESHSIMLIAMTSIGIFTFFSRKKHEATRAMAIVQNFAAIAYLGFGILIVSVDQLIRSGSVVFLSVCVAIGLVLLIRPVHAVMLYFASYFVYYYAIEFSQSNQSNQDILLSDRIHGISAIGLGIALSIIFWNIYMKNRRDREHINSQQLELAEKSKELEYFAFYDSMTKLLNRRRQEELIKREISNMQRYGGQACIVIIDVDYLKEFNDVYGHPTGDLVIEQMAAILRDNTRETDAVSRWGGDEFLILLTHTSLEEGKAITEKLRKIIEETSVMIEDKEAHITASFGITELKIDVADPLESAYKDADHALYMAKKKGRNCIEAI